MSLIDWLGGEEAVYYDEDERLLDHDEGDGVEGGEGEGGLANYFTSTLESNSFVSRRGRPPVIRAAEKVSSPVLRIILYRIRIRFSKFRIRILIESDLISIFCNFYSFQSWYKILVILFKYRILPDYAVLTKKSSFRKFRHDFWWFLSMFCSIRIRDLLIYLIRGTLYIIQCSYRSLLYNFFIPLKTLDIAH